MIDIGIGGVARQVRALYIGIAGKARRIRKAYIGVNGVAHKIYDYLDDIDHIEIQFNRCACYTSDNQDEGWNNVLKGKQKLLLTQTGT